MYNLPIKRTRFCLSFLYCFTAHRPCGRTQSGMLPPLPKTMRQWRISHGTYEICAQGSQRFRSARSVFKIIIHVIYELFFRFILKYMKLDDFSAKRRNANHPCPVCGKFYVNEGSLRKHLACHPEMANQLSSSLRMWPCTVCTAVFTHENGKNDYWKWF